MRTNAIEEANKEPLRVEGELKEVVDIYQGEAKRQRSGQEKRSEICLGVPVESLSRISPLHNITCRVLTCHFPL